MCDIEHVSAREVFDSRGRPTVEVEVQCAGAPPARAIVPSGASTGRFEALELRDGDAHRLQGRGVQKAVANVNSEIANTLPGRDAARQDDIDRLLCELDGTADKSRLGANALLGVSLATAYAAANAHGVAPVEHLRHVWQDIRRAQTENGDKPSASDSAKTVLGTRPLLPLPMVNMISGGLHAGGNLDVQDVLILTIGADSFRQALEWTLSVYYRLGRLLQEAGYEGHLVGDEGGYGPKLTSDREALEFVVRAIEAAGLSPGDDVCLGLDVAATHVHDAQTGRYRLSASGHETVSLTSEQMIDRLAEWVDAFPLISIEDGLAEDDWNGWTQLTRRLGDRVQLIGDDLFVTNRQRLERGIAGGAANSILIKPNQIGTLTETLQTMHRALQAGYLPVVSARSGETEDAAIADIAVATGAGQIKIGSVARSERLAKYNQLLRLQEHYGGAEDYLGGRIFDSLRK